MITRCCTQQEFLLRPSQATNAIFRYCLAVAAEQTGIQVHAVCVLSNHWHGVVSDPFARLPEFLERLHKWVAKAMNCLLDRAENLWSNAKTNIVLLVSDEDIIDKCAYVMANPTVAGLVESPEQWPGVLTRSMGEHWNSPMPDVYFDAEGDMPEVAALQFSRLPVCRNLSDAQLGRLLSLALEQHVRKASRARLLLGQTFAGAEAMLQRPVTDKPQRRRPRSRLIPNIAALSPVKRVRALRERADFLRRYREAWLAFRDGLHHVLFPPGTYALRRFAGVSVAPS